MKNTYYIFLFIFFSLSLNNLIFSQCPQPNFCNRICWSPNNNHPPSSNPTYTNPTHIIVHHSGDPNVWPIGTDFSQVVRGYWDYHVNTNNWADIGYNWLIDRNGVVYEGRGNGVQGAHFSCMNQNTMGICVIGNFDLESPTNQTLTKLKDLIAWEATDKNIDVLSSSYHNNSQLNLMNICGHKDGNSSSNSCTTTVCPGNNLYGHLSSLRIDISNYPCYNGQGGTTCNTPSGLWEPAIIETAASLLWNSVSNAQNYSYRYRASGTSNWTSGTTVDNFVTIFGLTCNTSYQWQVMAHCPNNNSSSYSNIRTFTTSACQTTCNTPTGTTETNITQTTATLNWNSVPEAIDYQVRYRIVGNSSWQNQYPINNFYNLTGLVCNTSYEWQVRTWCSSDNSSYSSIRTFTTSACQTTCDTPTGTTETNITQTTATLGWNDVSGAIGYHVQHRQVGSSSWQNQYPTNSILNLTGLLCNTSYEWRVRTECSTNDSDYSSIRTFATSACQTTCDAPTGTTETSITQTTATLNWNSVPGAINYNVQHRQVGGSWQSDSSVSNNLPLTGLLCDTSYEWRVMTECSNGSSNYSVIRTFSTSVCSGDPCNPPLPSPEITLNGNCDFAAEYINNVTYQWYLNGNALPGETSQFHTATDTGYYYVVITDTNNCTAQSQHIYADCETMNIDEITINNLTIYPNPNNGIFMISGYFNTSEPIKVKLYTVLGQVVSDVYTFQGGEVNKEISVSNLSQGMYLLQISVGKDTYYRKLIIER